MAGHFGRTLSHLPTLTLQATLKDSEKCPHQCRRLSSNAQPVSPPDITSRDGEYCCYVDFDSQIFKVSWKGTMDYPDLSSFPLTKDISIENVALSPEIASIWAESTLLEYGANACVRCLHTDVLPIAKIAHPEENCLSQIRYEFEFVKKLAKYSLPVAEIGSEPLQDCNGVYGYRLEKLKKIEISEATKYSKEVEDAVHSLHQHGFVHGDVSPSNVMETQRGDIVLIDFSFSGVVGEPIPDHIPEWAYKSKIFNTEADEERLKIFFRPRLAVES